MLYAVHVWYQNRVSFSCSSGPGLDPEDETCNNCIGFCTVVN